MKTLFMVLCCALATSALAQHPQSYSGRQERDIKALSGDEITQYQAGAGMSYALAAELNHYPGPLHALELADELKLTVDQRTALKVLMDSHKAEARAIGARLVEAERELDRLFSSRKVIAEDLQAKVQAAGRVQSEYRLSHLDTHRRTRELLTTAQIALYDERRGYSGGGAHGGHK